MIAFPFNDGKVVVNGTIKKWGVGSGEWGMGNGEWGIGNGELEVGVRSYY
ncbi:MAG: hypothetical protein DSM106950_41285 [Stigonema ocellatum SAG 48.90 = DSM 106950]|nr:hypothetical protein [Stigonema ocellatum SAG 48.90 = DSM 106950]